VEQETSWQCPNYESADDVKHGFVKRCIDQGITWYRESNRSTSLTRAMDILAGKTGGKVSTKWANFTTGDLKRGVLEIVEALSDIRPYWGYSTENKAFLAECNMMSKVAKSIYMESFVDRAIKDALQFAAISGAGFIYPFYSRSKFGMGDGEFVFMALGQPDVLPIQLPRGRNYQNAYIVTLVVQTGIAEAHARFPEFQSKLKPFGEKTYARTPSGNNERSYDRNRWRMHQLGSKKELFCVPLNSEILTRAGWKKYNEIAVGQEVMGYDKETGRCEWTRLEGVNLFQDKEVYQYGTKGFTVKCTKEHRWAVKRRIGKYKKDAYSNAPEMRTLDECTRQKTRLIQAAPAPDGPGLDAMEVEQFLERGNAEQMVLKMTSGERRAFIVGMLYGEGHKRQHGEGQRGTTQFAQNVGPVHDAMKLACALEGIATSSGRKVLEEHPCRTFTLLHNAERGLQNLTKKLVSTEDVWCPTTGLGTWLMRQGDTITITGNCDIYYTYVLDLRINYGEVDEQGNPVLGPDGNQIGKPLEMGQAGTSWAYTVPYVGQMITRFEGGKNVTRPATEDDCRVYPYRRLLISCNDALMYDGPAFDWHGMVPLVPFYLDEWAWEDTGFSLFQGTANTQDAIDDLMRYIYRVAMARANPGKVYNTDITTGDKQGKLTSRQAESLDPFDPGIGWGVDGDIKEPVLRPPFPEWCYNIPEWVMKIVEFLQASIMRQLGHDQIKSLEKLRANISDPEKLLDAEGPTVMGTSRSMERGFRDLARIFLGLVVQYMPVGVLADYVGVDAIAPATFDYKPYSIIPSHLEGEQTTDAAGNPVESGVTESERAKNFLRNIRVSVTPHSMHYIAQAQKKLNLLALLGKGVPIDPETLANEFDLSNWGSIEGSTIKEKVLNWAKEKLTDEAQIAKLQHALGLDPPDPGGKPGPKPGAPGSGAPAKKPGQGKIKQKGTASGGRAVVATT
jgi:hypothetical protein